MRKAILCLVLFSLIATACAAGETAPPSNTPAPHEPGEPATQATSPEPDQSPAGNSGTSHPGTTPAESPPAPLSTPDAGSTKTTQTTPTETGPAQTERLVNPLLIEGLQAIQLIGHAPFEDSFYALTPVGLYITRDGGSTWAQVTPDPLQDNFVFSSAEPGTLYAGAGADCYRGGPDQPFYKSINGGATWSELPNGVNLRPVAVHPSDPEQIWAIGCVGPAYSSNGGATWATSSAELFLLYDVSHIVPADADWSVVYVGGVSEGGSGVIARSQDTGQSWTPLLQESHERPLWWINDLVVLSQQLFLIDPHGVWRSQDGGNTWNFSNAGLDDVFYRDDADLANIGLNALAVNSHTTPPTVYVGTAQGVYQSLNGGETWVKLDDELTETPGSAGWQDTPVLDLALSSAPPENGTFGPSPRLFITTAEGVFVLEL